MQLIIKIKYCKLCGGGYLKGYNTSVIRWANRIYCSALCSQRKPISDEYRKNLSASKMGNQNCKGEKHARWKGGITEENKRSGLYTKRRRARKAAAEGFHTNGDWEILKAQYNWRCSRCRIHEPEIKLTEDHIVPLSKGGSDNIENIQPLCIRCNSIKATKTIRYAIFSNDSD